MSEFRSYSNGDYFKSYFSGYGANVNHPSMPATGTEGCCELCGAESDAPVHREPFVRVHEDWREAAQRWREEFEEAR